MDEIVIAAPARTGWFVIGSLLSLASALPLVGQPSQPAGVRIGDRVRVASVDLPTERIARVLALGAASVTLRYARHFGDGTVARRGVRLLAVSEGRRSRAQGERTGAGRGLIFGAIIGGISAIVGLVAAGSDEIACIGCGTFIVVVPAVVIVATTATGAALGAASPGERWRLIIPAPRF